MIRWLIAGSGMAAGVHARAIELCDGAELAGVVTPSGQADLGAPVFNSLDRAFDQLHPDGIIIASPHHTHRSIALAAIERQVPVLCEKPAGRNVAEAREICDTASAKQVPVGVVLNQRACAHHRFIKHLVQSGALNPHRAQFSASLGQLRGWLTNADHSGGGVLRTVGIHYLDLLRWWFGEPAEMSAHITGARIDTVAVVSARFGQSTIGTVSIAMAGAPPRGPVTCEIDGDGTALTLRANEIIESHGIEAPPDVEKPDSKLFFGPGHATVIAEASLALARQQPFPVTLASALPSLAMVDTAYELAKAP